MKTNIANFIQKKLEPEEGRPSVPPPEGEIQISRLKHPFQQPTYSHRRNLIIASSAVLILSIPEIKFTSTFLMDLSEAKSLDLASGIISVVAIYEVIMFYICWISDILMWRIHPAEKVASYYQGKVVESLDLRIKNLSDSTNKLEESISNEENQNELREARKKMREILDSCYDFVKDFTTSVSRVEKRANIASAFMLVRVTIFDIGIPSLIFVIALLTAKQSLVELVTVAIHW